MLIPVDYKYVTGTYVGLTQGGGGVAVNFTPLLLNFSSA